MIAHRETGEPGDITADGTGNYALLARERAGFFSTCNGVIPHHRVGVTVVRKWQPCERQYLMAPATVSSLQKCSTVMRPPVAI
jgi:hypothetical protein